MSECVCGGGGGSFAFAFFFVCLRVRTCWISSVQAVESLWERCAPRELNDTDDVENFLRFSLKR